MQQRRWQAESVECADRVYDIAHDAGGFFFCVGVHYRSDRRKERCALVNLMGRWTVAATAGHIHLRA
jgi:hypothetical protein